MRVCSIVSCQYAQQLFQCKLTVPSTVTFSLLKKPSGLTFQTIGSFCRAKLLKGRTLHGNIYDIRVEQVCLLNFDYNCKLLTLLTDLSGNWIDFIVESRGFVEISSNTKLCVDFIFHLITANFYLISLSLTNPLPCPEYSKLFEFCPQLLISI